MVCSKQAVLNFTIFLWQWCWVLSKKRESHRPLYSRETWSSPRTTDAQLWLFSSKFQTFRHGQPNWADRFLCIWGIFSQTISRGFLQRQSCKRQLFLQKIYFFYKIFSLDSNQNSAKNANIADCLKKHLKTHKTKQINSQIIWQETSED